MLEDRVLVVSALDSEVTPREIEGWLISHFKACVYVQVCVCVYGFAMRSEVRGQPISTPQEA